MSEFNPLDPFIDAITEVANKTYDDTLHPVLQETGKSLALIGALMLLLLALQIGLLTGYKIRDIENCWTTANISLKIILNLTLRQQFKQYHIV